MLYYYLNKDLGLDRLSKTVLLRFFILDTSLTYFKIIKFYRNRFVGDISVSVSCGYVVDMCPPPLLCYSIKLPITQWEPYHLAFTHIL